VESTAVILVLARDMRTHNFNRVFEQTLCSHLLPHNGEADHHSSRKTRHRKVQ
jgi:hypothetical protein